MTVAFTLTRTTLATLQHCSGLNGLTIHPVAPAAFPSSFFSCCDSVVSMRIGVNLNSGFARSCRIMVMPSMTGI